MLSTTPADLEDGIEAAIARCFAGVDDAAEARVLGVPEQAIRDFRDGLRRLGEIAARAAAHSGPAGPADA